MQRTVQDSKMILNLYFETEKVQTHAFKDMFICLQTQLLLQINVERPVEPHEG